MLSEQRHTNIKSAVVEAHQRARAEGVAYYVYGESGTYRISVTRPEAELQYVQVTPTGNEWTFRYDPRVEGWRKTRLGWLGESRLAQLVEELALATERQ